MHRQLSSRRRRLSGIFHEVDNAWKGIGPLPSDPRHREILRQAALQIDAELKAQDHGHLPEVGAEVAGGALIKQWSESAEPVPPWARLALTMADVALEFVAAKPTVLGIGSNGEKLIGAFADNLAELIPDDIELFGVKRQFSERWWRLCSGQVSRR